MASETYAIGAMRFGQDESMLLLLAVTSGLAGEEIHACNCAQIRIDGRVPTGNWDEVVEGGIR